MGKTCKEQDAIMDLPGPAAVGRQCSGAHFEPVRPVWPRVAWSKQWWRDPAV